MPYEVTFGEVVDGNYGVGMRHKLRELLNNVRECAFGFPKIPDTGEKQQRSHGRRNHEFRCRNGVFSSQNASAKAVDDSQSGIERKDEAQLFVGMMCDGEDT